jgi:hypothetical protein
LPLLPLLPVVWYDSWREDSWRSPDRPLRHAQLRTQGYREGGALGSIAFIVEGLPNSRKSDVIRMYYIVIMLVH